MTTKEQILDSLMLPFEQERRALVLGLSPAEQRIHASLKKLETGNGSLEVLMRIDRDANLSLLAQSGFIGADVAALKGMLEAEMAALGERLEDPKSFEDFVGRQRFAILAKRISEMSADELQKKPEPPRLVVSNDERCDPYPVREAPKRGYAEHDVPLVKDAFDIVDRDRIAYWAAAEIVAPRAKGGGSAESKTRRIYERMKAERPESH